MTRWFLVPGGIGLSIPDAVWVGVMVAGAGATWFLLGTVATCCTPANLCVCVTVCAGDAAAAAAM